MAENGPERPSPVSRTPRDTKGRFREKRFVSDPDGRVERPLSARGRTSNEAHQTGEALSIRPRGLRKSTDKLSENPNPCRPKASRTVFEKI
jgi:hypothetical protein